VIASDPINVAAYCDLAESFDKQRLYEDAEAACEKALAINSELARPHFLLGHIRAHQKRSTESEAEFRKVIELDDRFINSYIGLATTLSTQGRSSEAETCLKPSVSS
jgi:tetratricopeptide (TPR) repeat protein